MNDAERYKVEMQIADVDGKQRTEIESRNRDKTIDSNRRLGEEKQIRV